MADQFIQVPPQSTGLKVDCTELTVGANTVERERQNLADPTDAAGLAKVLNSAPAGTEYALVTRNIPSGTQPVSGTFFQATQPISGTVTANVGTTNGLALDATVSGLQVTQGSATSGESGPLVMGAVTTGAPTYITAQTSPLSLTTAGGLRVDGSGTTQPVSGTVSVTNFANPLPVTLASTTITGTVAENVSQVAGVTLGSTAVTNYGTAPAAAAVMGVNAFVTNTPAVTGSGNFTVTQATGTNLHTVLDSGTLTSITNAITVSQATAANLNATVTGTVTANAGTGTFSVDDVASSATASAVPANAVYGGGRAATSNPTSATNGNLVGIMADKAGRMVVTTGHVRDLVGVQTTTIAAASETTVITAGAAGVFNDITSLSITNSAATAMSVTLKDSTAGTTRAIYDLAANGGIVLTFTPPLPQATAANNWTITPSSTNSIHVNAVFVKNL